MKVMPESVSQDALGNQLVVVVAQVDVELVALDVGAKMSSWTVCQSILKEHSV